MQNGTCSIIIILICHNDINFSYVLIRHIYQLDRYIRQKARKID